MAVLVGGSGTDDDVEVPRAEYDAMQAELERGRVVVGGVQAALARKGAVTRAYLQALLDQEAP